MSGLNPIKKEEIQEIIKRSIRTKLQNYKPETEYMPFHYRLLGKDRMALFSFIHSLNTKFGTSIYEPVAIALAQNRFAHVATQQKPHHQISEECQRQIQHIIDRLATAEIEVDKQKELEQIRKVCRQGQLNTVKLTKVDVWLEGENGHLYLIDLKSPKPNAGDFEKFKRMLLEWAGAELAKNPETQIHTLIGMPYNPYEPEPYKRWTMKGMLDLKEELLVAEELWDFIGGKGTYPDLLTCFEQAGLALRAELDKHFRQFQ